MAEVERVDILGAAYMTANEREFRSRYIMTVTQHSFSSGKALELWSQGDTFYCNDVEQVDELIEALTKAKEWLK